jgi:glycine betaine/proline transport system substrate-binding protein
MLRRESKAAALAAAVCGFLMAAHPERAAAEAPESQDPIRIALFDWTSVNVNANILGGIYKRLGYNVEYVTADYLSSLTTGLTNGDITVIMEEWDTTGQEAMRASDATGKTENLGKLGPKAKEEWWYPSYMKEKCPGLPNWEALKDPKCAEAFSTAETAPKGRYLSGPSTWGGFDEERVQALGVPFDVVRAGTDGAMWAELESAYVRKAPIMLWIYSPHWAPAKYEGEWIEFPEYTAECYGDPKWGINPDMAYDCGKPHGEIWKYGWAEMKNIWPVAYHIAKNYTIDAKELGLLAGQVDLENKSIEEVAEAWVNANEGKWRAWAAATN